MKPVHIRDSPLGEGIEFSGISLQLDAAYRSGSVDALDDLQSRELEGLSDITSRTREAGVQTKVITGT